MHSLKKFTHTIQQHLFESVVANRLVYNACWEDPRVDRRLLQIRRGSRIVMLTSAGCNALDYLLDDPSEVYAVDTNSAQNALLELKMGVFRWLDHEQLFDLFGRGKSFASGRLYNASLRDRLPGYARAFWDNHIDYFSGGPSFYFRGTSGRVAQMMHNRIRHKGLFADVLNLLDAKTLPEQRYYFDEVEPRLWSGFYRWLVKQQPLMTLLGVPPAQRSLVEKENGDGMLSFIRSALHKVFTGLPVRDNYFWRVYLTGSYTPGCCPNYLKPEYFDTLSDRADRIRCFNGSLIRFLERNPGRYTHFVLLDHQDWMAHRQPAKLEKEWKLILENAAPGARILFRSASAGADWLPVFVRERVSFQTGLTRKLHETDRVGTYASTHLGVVHD